MSTTSTRTETTFFLVLFRNKNGNESVMGSINFKILASWQLNSYAGEEHDSIIRIIPIESILGSHDAAILTATLRLGELSSLELDIKGCINELMQRSLNLLRAKEIEILEEENFETTALES